MKGYIKGIKEYLTLGFYLVSMFAFIVIFAMFMTPLKNANIELYKKTVLCLRCILWIYIMLGDVFYSSLFSRILNYKYITGNKYKLKILLNNFVRFGILGLTVILHLQLSNYPKYLSLLNIIYIGNIIFCFIPKYNCPLMHKLLKIEMVYRRDRIKK